MTCTSGLAHWGLQQQRQPEESWSPSQPAALVQAWLCLGRRAAGFGTSSQLYTCQHRVGLKGDSRLTCLCTYSVEPGSSPVAVQSISGRASTAWCCRRRSLLCVSQVEYYYITAANQLQRPYVRCIVVGDSNRSVEAAHELGMKSVIVTGNQPAWNFSGADLVVRNLSQLSFVNMKKLFGNEDLVEAQFELEQEQPEYL